MDGITFDYDSDAIQPASFPILDEAVKILNAYPQILLLVEGHTSSEGEAKYNLDLSRRRAESVRTYMVKQGVGEKRIETVGYGADRPLDSSDSDAAREKNRRIEFKILRQ
jgi:outer membrane protein OmpA-like peptidoglycan-associated protein